jgi:hypothetical protein
MRSTSRCNDADEEYAVDLVAHGSPQQHEEEDLIAMLIGLPRGAGVKHAVDSVVDPTGLGIGAQQADSAAG